MLTNEEAEELLNEPKATSKKYIDLALKENTLDLISDNDGKNTFQLNISQSLKIEFKITNHLHTQGLGLLRLDYKGRHRNPETVTKTVPDFLHPYISKQFDRDAAHIHIYVEGFDLKWAVPVEKYAFPVYTVSSQSEFAEAIKAFSQKINLKTTLEFEFGIT